MRNKIFLALLCCFLSLSAAAYAGAPGAGDPAPRFEAVDLSGGKISSGEVSRSGRAMVLNFWGLRCAACIMEMPHVNLLAEKYKDRVNVYGVNVDGIGPPVLAGQIKKMKLEIGYTVVPDPDMKLVDLFRMAAAPLTIVIDAGGIVRYRHEGYEPGDESKIEEALRKALVGGEASAK